MLNECIGCLAALAQNEEMSKDIIAILTKEMSSSKVPVRRAVCAAVGSALWELGESKTVQSKGIAEAEDGAESGLNKPTSISQWTPAATSFLAALTPAFEANLKTVSATPLNLAAGPLEGYVVVAIAFSRGAKDGFGELCAIS